MRILCVVALSALVALPPVAFGDDDAALAQELVDEQERVEALGKRRVARAYAAIANTTLGKAIAAQQKLCGPSVERNPDYDPVEWVDCKIELDRLMGKRKQILKALIEHYKRTGTAATAL